MAQKAERKIMGTSRRVGLIAPPTNSHLNGWGNRLPVLNIYRPAYKVFRPGSRAVRHISIFLMVCSVCAALSQHPLARSGIPAVEQPDAVKVVQQKADGFGTSLPLLCGKVPSPSLGECGMGRVFREMPRKEIFSFEPILKLRWHSDLELQSRWRWQL